MMLPTTRLVLALAVMLLTACSDAGNATPQNLPQRDLYVGPHRVTVQIADTDATRSYGLMFVSHLPDQQGMLFVWPDARVRSFWMRNTLIPLDLLFIREGRIFHIHAHAKPHDETPLPSTGPADSVLEVNGGWAARHGVTVGDSLTWP